jgi:hypothetical protein
MAMTKQKRIFLVAAVIFLLIMLLIGYDISRRTTFPGQKTYLKESIAPD